MENLLQTYCIHTRSNFWGGPWYSYWSLIAFTIIGGLFGLDHFWLRSPMTGILKIIVNIFTFGLWYFYDILQILGDKDNVMKHGLTIPLIGPMGIGAGMFVDNNGGKNESKSPWRLLAYMLLVCLPFGLDFFIAGDTTGGVVRLLSNIIYPIAFIWGCVSMFHIFFMTQDVLEKGPYRMFPFSWVMDPRGPSKLGPKDLEAGPSCGESGILGSILSLAVLFFPGVAPAVEGVSLATRGVSGAISAVSGAVGTASETATTILEAAKNPITQTVGIASGIAGTVPTALGGLSGATGQVTGEMAKFSTEDGLRGLAQKGGALLQTTDWEGIGLIVVLSAILGLGAYSAVKRLQSGQSFFSSKKNGRERNDAPPEPRRF